MNINLEKYLDSKNKVLVVFHRTDRLRWNFDEILANLGSRNYIFVGNIAQKTIQISNGPTFYFKTYDPDYLKGMRYDAWEADFAVTVRERETLNALVR